MDDGWISHPIFPLQRSCDQLALQIAVATYPAAIACPTIPETFFPHGVVVVASSAMPIRSSEEQIRHLKDMSVGSMDGHAGYTPLREPYLKSSDHINIPINDLKLPRNISTSARCKINPLVGYIIVVGNLVAVGMFLDRRIHWQPSFV